MSFVRDLKAGKTAEKQVIGLFENNGIPCQPVPKHLRCYYDFTISFRHKDFQVEVKCDFLAIKSGNICIEIGNSKTGRDTGITVTKSHLWAHVLGDKIWLASTFDLKKYVELCAFGYLKKVDKAGDGNAQCLIFKQDLILPLLFTECTQLDSSKFHLLITNLTKSI